MTEGVPPAFLFAIAFTSLVCKQTFTLEYKLNILFFFEKVRGAWGEWKNIFSFNQEKSFSAPPKKSPSSQITSFRRGCGCVCRRFRLRERRGLRV